MSKNNCGFINDLLPLYVDDVCSEESRQIVAEHLSECTECRSKLEKMGRKISVSADNDIRIIKSIKKKILIEKVVISVVIAAAVLFSMAGAFFFLLNTGCSMDYEKYNLAENVWVEEDDNGDLWLVKKGEAASANFIFPTVSDENGNHLGYDDDFNKDKKNGYGITLKQRKICALAFSGMYNDNEERTLIKNTDDFQFSKIFYYDDENNKEYILWEEK